jgi:hypothetical protein
MRKKKGRIQTLNPTKVTDAENKMARQIGPFALYLESMRNDQVDGIGDHLINT